MQTITASRIFQASRPKSAGFTEKWLLDSLLKVNIGVQSGKNRIPVTLAALFSPGSVRATSRDKRPE
jgi:hypothetical protein